MKTITTTAVVALLTATMGLGAIAPALAQETSPAQTQAAPPAPAPMENQRGPGMPGAGMRQGGGLDSLFNVQRGAEDIEIAIVRLSYRLDLSDEQKTLLDDLKTAALDAADQFQSATESMRPTPPTGDTQAPTGDTDEQTSATAPDFSMRLENRIAMEKAHLAALEAIQPAAKAFFDSLSDEQKAQMAPQRRHGPMGMQGRPGMNDRFGPRHDHRDMGRDQHHRGMQGQRGHDGMKGGARPGAMAPDAMNGDAAPQPPADAPAAPDAQGTARTAPTIKG